MSHAVAAVDLGATSGRVMLGHVDAETLRLEPVARFDNRPVAVADALHWNVLDLYQNIVEGLGRAAARAELLGVGIDSWAVDYALLRAGRVLGFPHHYRDRRNPPAAERTHRVVGFDRLYAEAGLQYLPFNTVYQLVAERDGGLLGLADRLLLIPDLIGHLLGGRAVTERTNASTTGLIDIHTGRWNRPLLDALSIPDLFAPLVDPGTRLGPVRESLGLAGSPELITVGSHDTASAVVAVPATGEDFAYISSGTWSLVGLELPRPVVTEAARAANFTNESGVDGRTRFLRNVSGLWLLDESVRTWRAAGADVDLPALLDAAAAVDAATVVRFDTDDPRFLPPGDIPSRIAEWCREHDLPVPRDRPAMTRSILESLAAAYARAIRAATVLTGRDVTTVHIVGGGCRNRLLCQLTADHTGLPVLAGPTEATALGNLLVQARALGLVHGDLPALRARVAEAFPPVRYRPHNGRP